MYDVWKNALAEIEQKISPDNFSTWFQDTSIISSRDGNIIIGVKNSFYVKQLRIRYYDFIKTALENNQVPVKNINFEVKDNNKTKIKPREVTHTISREQLKSTSRISDLKPTTTPTADNGLNSNYTMDNFIVASNNDLVVAIANNIIEAPGTKYNPFFLYGGPGLGKTHLVQAIGNELLRRNPSIKILYTPISDFYSDFIDYVRSGKGKEFSAKFQSLDCLIIDDFQLIVGKEKSQEEFFNIFNNLRQRNKQIIVTSDRLPSQIKTIDERLASRLAWAGTYDIQLPKFEDRCAILRAKAELQGINIEPEAIEYIAENINTNIRELEGELARVMLMSEVRGVSPLELIRNGSIAINKTAKPSSLTSKQIVDKVAKYYNLTPKEMCGKSRVAHIKNARQITMFLLAKELNISTNKIAAEVGVSDHTTVMHGIKRIENEIKLDFALRDQIEEIREKIYG